MGLKSGGSGFWSVVLPCLGFGSSSGFGGTLLLGSHGTEGVGLGALLCLVGLASDLGGGCDVCSPLVVSIARVLGHPTTATRSSSASKF